VTKQATGYSAQYGLRNNSGWFADRRLPYAFAAPEVASISVVSASSPLTFAKPFGVALDRAHTGAVGHRAACKLNPAGLRGMMALIS
jgi:hypothetical protein